MQRQASQQHQPTQNATSLSLQKREPSVTVHVVQNEAPNKPSFQPASNSTGDLHKQTQHNVHVQDNLSHNKNNNETFDELRLYRGGGHNGINEKPQLTENRLVSSSSPGTSIHSDKKLTVVSVSSRHDSMSNPKSSDSNHATFLRHPRTNSSGSSTQKNLPTHLQVPHQKMHLQQGLSQHQHQQLKEPQQILRDHSPQNEDPRMRAHVIRVRSYPMGRQHQHAALHSTLQKQGNVGQPWSIPRVTTSGSGRPHSLTLPSTRHHEGFHSTPREFSNYNPSASPRALRSHTRIDSDNILRQASPSNSVSSPSPAITPPKSILKNNPSTEQPDLTANLRPLMLPRAHSDKNQNNEARNYFDFSSILTTTKDTLSPKTTNNIVKGQVYTQATSSVEAPPSQQQRPATASAVLTKNELNQDGRPTKKSVTFNSLVRLHHEI